VSKGKPNASGESWALVRSMMPAALSRRTRLVSQCQVLDGDPRSGNLIAGDGTKNGLPGRVEDWRASWPRHPDRATFPAPSTFRERNRGFEAFSLRPCVTLVPTR
jgi:hypothetical protein